ncbi:MAG: hypothetical protein BEN19_07510 [Epulopiscium sp. Nuni2H_MBin003]|nr:MAG: hypothetical protein BEN19_07510 [Epulopiscium sp. Nuni2H_MBin003]
MEKTKNTVAIFSNLSDRVKGILLILLSALAFAFMSAFVKLAGPLPSFQKVFFRNIVSAFVAAYLVYHFKGSYTGKKSNRQLILYRSIFGTLGIIFNFYAIDHLVLSDATMLNKLSPLFVILFSYMFLKEKINRRQILCITIAFLGALLIIKPSFNADLLPGIAGVLGAVGAGLAYTCLRGLGKSEPYYTTVFIFSTLSSLIVLPFAIYFYIPMTSSQLTFLLLAGACSTVSQFALTLAYGFAPAKEISIFDYTNVIFSALISLALFGELPDFLSIIGYIVIFTVALYMFFYQKKAV